MHFGTCALHTFSQTACTAKKGQRALGCFSCPIVSCLLPFQCTYPHLVPPAGVPPLPHVPSPVSLPTDLPTCCLPAPLPSAPTPAVCAPTSCCSVHLLDSDYTFCFLLSHSVTVGSLSRLTLLPQFGWLPWLCLPGKQYPPQLLGHCSTDCQHTLSGSVLLKWWFGAAERIFHLPQA